MDAEQVASLKEPLAGHSSTDPTDSPPPVQRTFSTAAVDGIGAVLEAVEGEAVNLKESEGLSQASFFLGVVNVPVVCFMIAWYPAQLWVLYWAECLVLIPLWWSSMCRFHRGALFILDFCWMANICFTVYMACLYFDMVPDVGRRAAFVTFFSVALGPLGWACIVLHNGLIFHSVAKIASLFIHMTPGLVAWTVVSSPDTFAEQWPGRFPTREELQEVTIGEVFQHGMCIYLVWLVLHGAWLLSAGIHCPEKGMRTIFNNVYTARKLGPLFTRKTGIRSLRGHAALYLLLHLLLCMVAFAWSILCLKCIAVHGGFCVAVFLSAAWSGAGYYEHVMSVKYTKVVRAMYEERYAASAGKRAALAPEA